MSLIVVSLRTDVAVTGWKPLEMSTVQVPFFPFLTVMMNT